MSEEVQHGVELIVRQSVDEHNQLSVTSYMDLVDNIVKLVDQRELAAREACALIAHSKLIEEDIERPIEQRNIDGAHNGACLQIYDAIKESGKC